MRHREEAEQENGDRWLLTYSDLITLLMAFFIVMYAMAQVDQKKWTEVSYSLKAALGTLPGGTGKMVGFGGNGSPDGNTAATLPFAAATDPDLAQTQESFEQLVAQEGLENAITVTTAKHKLVITLSNELLFDVGRADLTPRSKQLLDRIAAILLRVDNDIRVEGYTDNTPIHTARYISNWQLSTDRATNVIMYLIQSCRFPPERLSASGYGQYKPTFPNDTPEHKAKNRRVDFVVIGKEFPD